jgi:hypothetical protein
MAITTADVYLDLRDYLGHNFDARRTKVYAVNNIPGETIFDLTNNKTWLGGGKTTITTEGIAIVNVPTPGDSNPATWQTTIVVDYLDAATNLRKERRFGPFTITEGAVLDDLVAEQEVPPTYLTTVTAELQAYVETATDLAASSSIAATTAAASATSAAASAELAEYIAGIATPDGVVTALLNSLSSATRAAVLALIAGSTYDSGWISVGYPGTSTTWTRPDGTVAIIPVFQSSWYHHDPAFPVQFRRRGNEVMWRGWTEKTTGAIGDPVATSISPDDVAITHLEYLAPTARGFEYKLPAGTYGVDATSMLVGPSTGTYTLRYASGSGAAVALDSIRYFVDN